MKAHWTRVLAQYEETPASGEASQAMFTEDAFAAAAVLLLHARRAAAEWMELSPGPSQEAEAMLEAARRLENALVRPAPRPDATG